MTSTTVVIAGDCCLTYHSTENETFSELIARKYSGLVRDLTFRRFSGMLTYPLLADDLHVSAHLFGNAGNRLVSRFVFLLQLN